MRNLDSPETQMLDECIAGLHPSFHRDIILANLPIHITHNPPTRLYTVIYKNDESGAKKFGNYYFLDIRLWYQEFESRKWYPGRKGVRFNIKHFESFLENLQRLQNDFCKLLSELPL